MKIWLFCNHSGTWTGPWEGGTNSVWFWQGGAAGSSKNLPKLSNQNQRKFIKVFLSCLQNWMKSVFLTKFKFFNVTQKSVNHDENTTRNLHKNAKYWPKICADIPKTWPEFAGHPVSDITWVAPPHISPGEDRIMSFSGNVGLFLNKIKQCTAIFWESGLNSFSWEWGFDWASMMSGITCTVSFLRFCQRPE